MFKNWLMKFSFFRKREFQKVKDQLNAVKENFENGHFNDIFIAVLHKILKSPVVRFDEDLVLGDVRHLTTYSNTSMKLLTAFNEKEILKSNLERSKLLGMIPHTRYFQDWYSNQESIEEFIEEMKLWMSLFLYRNNDETHGESIYQVPYAFLDSNPDLRICLSEREESFMESLTSRLLMLDLVSILEFYLGVIEDDEETNGWRVRKK